VDADRDGKYETIVRMRCERGLSEVAPEQIILLGRGTGGQIRTWGQVVTTKDGIRQIGEITGLTDGSIRVDVRDRGLCCSSPYTDTQHQWRTYSWDGQKFAQTAGATAFSTQTVELAVAMNDLVFGKPVDGVRTGTLRVTVQNMGGTAVPRVLLVTELFHAQITTPGWTVTRVGQGMEAAFAGLAVSGAATIDLTFRTTESNRSMVGVGIIAIGMTTEGDYLRDTKPLNNQGEATSGIQAVIRFS